MTRTFSAHQSRWFQAAAIMLWIAAAVLLWYRMVLPGIFMLFLALVGIERIIHTSYVINGTCLTILHGRLSSPQRFLLDGIAKVEQRGSRVELTLSTGKRLSLYPDNPASFVKHIAGQIGNI